MPPYSPNLNLIERLWKLLRKKCINTHSYPDFKDFRQSNLNFFEQIDQYKKELDTPITFNFQRLGKGRQRSTPVHIHSALTTYAKITYKR